MKNYDRYAETTEIATQTSKKSVMSHLCRIPSDKKLIPLLSQITGKKILDVGLGSGYYTKILIKNNSVIGLDPNPHLCKLPIKIHKGLATELEKLVEDEKYDLVVSTWMTEYLNGAELETFFKQSKKALYDNGRLITTIISKQGLGFLYIFLARVIKSIDKYNYTQRQTIEKLKTAGYTNIKIIKLTGRLCIPWAYLVIAE